MKIVMPADIKTLALKFLNKLVHSGNTLPTTGKLTDYIVIEGDIVSPDDEPWNACQ